MDKELMEMICNHVKTKMHKNLVAKLTLLQSKRKKPKEAINIYIANNNNNNKNKDIIILSYGNYKIFTYDKNGDPLFLIGPDYAYFSFLFILNFIYFVFLF